MTNMIDDRHHVHPLSHHDRVFILEHPFLFEKNTQDHTIYPYFTLYKKNTQTEKGVSEERKCTTVQSSDQIGCN